MLALAQKLYNQLLSDLSALDEEHQPDLYVPDRRLDRIGETMALLKEELSGYSFVNETEEILFYKTVFPPILSLQIYYNEKSGLEINQLIGTKKSIKDYTDRLLKRIDEFSEQNGVFYDYCAMRKTGFDNHYFLRNSPMNQEPTILFGSVVDPKFCPAYSIKLAMMSAYRRLDEELSRVAAHDNPGLSAFVSNLKWTGTIAGLTELIYPLVKYINHGNVNVKEIALGFQQLFNVDLGNYSRTIQEIKRRKSGDNNFLLQLAEDFSQWIEDHENERLRRKHNAK
jgi:RteC protein